MTSFQKFLILPLGILLVLMITVYLVFFSPYTAAPPPVLGQVSDFALTDSTGNPFHKTELQDKVWVANFIFTSCAGVCPLMTQKMQSLYRSYDHEEGIDFVSISVDPDVDTPEKLAEYAKRYNADPAQWHFLTGSYEDIRTLAVESFKVGKIDEPIFHSDNFILVDAKSQIRGYYAYNEKQEIQQLFHDMALVLKETP